MKILAINHLTQGLDLMRKVAHFQGTDYAKNMPEFLRDCPNIKNVRMEEAKDLIRIFRERKPNHYLISSKKDPKPRRTKSLRAKARVLFRMNLYSSNSLYDTDSPNERERYYFYNHGIRSAWSEDMDYTPTTKLKIVTNRQLFRPELEEDIDKYIEEQLLLLGDGISIKVAESLEIEPLIDIVTPEVVEQVVEQLQSEVESPIMIEVKSDDFQSELQLESQLKLDEPLIPEVVKLEQPEVLKELPTPVHQPIFTSHTIPKKSKQKSKQIKHAQNKGKKKVQREEKVRQDKINAGKLRQEIKAYYGNKFLDLGEVCKEAEKAGKEFGMKLRKGFGVKFRDSG